MSTLTEKPYERSINRRIENFFHYHFLLFSTLPREMWENGKRYVEGKKFVDLNAFSFIFVITRRSSYLGKCVHARRTEIEKVEQTQPECEIRW